MLDFLHTYDLHSAVISENARIFSKIRKKTKALYSAYETTVEQWSKALEQGIYETARHTERRAKIAIAIGEKMDLNYEQIEKIKRGSLLHDIGKLGIPDSILLKPDQLNVVERKILQKHSIIAYELLQPIKFLKNAIQIPYGHHEKWDGSGYPRGLKGEEIPREARIFAIVEVRDALLSDRPFRKAWSESKVLNYMHEQSGCYFDPNILDVFLAYIQENKEKFN